MYFNDFLPSIWRKGSLPIKQEETHPFNELQMEMNRVFDNFFKDFDLSPFETKGDGFGKYNPSIDVKENEKEITITAELPGMEEKDFELLMTEDALTIKGEKREDKEDKGKDYYRMERHYGYFNRVIPLPDGIETKNVDANFKNGVLKITLPKTEEAKKKVKKIAVK